MSSAVWMLHGLASSPSEFGLIRHPLRRSGISLETPELDGYSHGRMTGETACWRRWLHDATSQVEALSRTRQEPLWIGGLCSGALIAAGVAIKRPDLVRGLVMLSPLVAYDGWGLPLWYRFRHLAYWLGVTARFEMKERFPYGVKCERMRAWVVTQFSNSGLTHVGPPVVNLTLVRETERLSRFVRGHLHQLTRPTCIVHALEDEICRWSSVQSFARRIVGTQAQVSCVEDSYHMITLDKDRATVAQRMAEFILSSERAFADCQQYQEVRA